MMGTIITWKKLFSIFIVFANQNIHNLFMNAVLLLIIRNHKFLNNQKKIKQLSLTHYSCQFYLKQKAHSRLIELIEFFAEYET